MTRETPVSVPCVPQKNTSGKLLASMRYCDYQTFETFTTFLQQTLIHEGKNLSCLRLTVDWTSSTMHYFLNMLLSQKTQTNVFEITCRYGVSGLFPFVSSRGRARHAKSAANAFTLGDHSRARELARLAREEGEVARELHAQAAEKILAERNADKLGGIWEIDLHGLHANEVRQ